MGLKRACDAYGTTRTALTRYVVTVREVGEDKVQVPSGYASEVRVELSKRGFERLMDCVARGTSAVGRKGKEEAAE